MAVYRGGIAFWVRCGRSHGCRHPIKRQCWTPTKSLDLRHSGPSRPISCFSWVRATPSHLRYQTVGQAAFDSPLSNPARHAGNQVRILGLDEDWEEAVSLCVLLGPGEPEGQRTLVEVHLLGQTRLGDLLASGTGRPGEFLFPLTTVDGRREDDISVSGRGGGERQRDGQMRERESFRSLFEAERCPAPFMWGSQFYCFHCPEKEPSPGHRAKSSLRTGQDVEARNLSAWHSVSYCSHSEAEGGEEQEKQREREREEKLAVMYERLRVELPSFFVKNHDYGLGRGLYQLTLSVWKLLTYDAFSTFHLGSDGLIHRHRVEKVMQASPPALPRVTSLLAGALVAMGIQEHRPALNLLPFLLSSLRVGRQ
ncbi:hypothetical protein JZ751_004292 [Albula glossodonta]|uniref:Uncharacterized protein n=1 Tax=Albula glossodonta TaxID=121402 RepID=A0A8T2NA76_9TELE|nr:hypothetical protein JZ751_004292 [Albula glossodonta]